MSRARRRRRPGELRGGLAWSRVGRGCGSLPLSSAGASGQECVLSVPLDLACGVSGEDAPPFPLQFSPEDFKSNLPKPGRPSADFLARPGALLVWSDCNVTCTASRVIDVCQ